VGRAPSPANYFVIPSDEDHSQRRMIFAVEEPAVPIKLIQLTLPMTDDQRPTTISHSHPS
jgi:hypothetical protein